MYNDNFQYDFVNYEESNQKKTKKNSKLKFIILIVATIIAIILSIVFIKMASTDNYYIILDNSGVIEYSDGTYSYAKNDDYLKSNFRVFSQKEYVGNYYIKRVDTSNDVLFTNIHADYNYVFNKPLVAISNNIKYIEFTNEEFDQNDFEIFYNVSSKDYITKLSDLLDTVKITLDFDGDGQEETLYSVTYEYNKNFATDDNEEISKYNYSLLYYVKDDYIDLIAENEPCYEEESIVFPSYGVSAVIDADNDGVYEIIMQNRMYDEPIYEIYKMVNGSYVSVFSTSLGGE